MHQPNLPPDDLPPDQIMPIDSILRRQLESAIGRRFYEACDGVTQSLLTSCEWFVTTTTSALTLVVNCPDMPTHWRVLNNIAALTSPLERFSSGAKIQVCPPVHLGIPGKTQADGVSI
jgi:hypothetical protein